MRVAEDFLGELKTAEGSNLSFAGVYGSVAEGKDKKGSDIDILIVVGKRKKEADEMAHKLVARYLKDSGELISPIVLTESEFRRNKDLETPYIKNVLAGRIIYGA